VFFFLRCCVFGVFPGICVFCVFSGFCGQFACFVGISVFRVFGFWFSGFPRFEVGIMRRFLDFRFVIVCNGF